MNLDIWARKWGIPSEAIDELRREWGVYPFHDSDSGDAKRGSEARQQDLVSLEAARISVRLFRNNSGAFRTDDGRMVRFGLGNVSKQWNAVFASPDLVGWRPRIITPDMIGTTIGQACMREMKHEGWKFNPNDPHETAQFNFLKLAIADGCDAAFATGPGTL